MAWPDTPRLTMTRSPSSSGSSPTPAHVGDPVGPDLPGVDRRLFFVLADARQAGEEIGPVRERLGVEPGVKLAHDVPAGMEALLLRPGLEVTLPGQPRGAPLIVVPPQPVVMVCGRRQPVKAPPGGALVEPLPRPLHDHQPPTGGQCRAGQVQHLADVAYMVQRR